MDIDVFNIGPEFISKLYQVANFIEDDEQSIVLLEQ